MGVRVTGDSSDHFPEMTGFGPGCDASRVFDPAVIGSHVLVRALQQNTDTLKQGRFTTTWVQDGLKLDVGGSYMTDEFTLKNSNTFANIDRLLREWGFTLFDLDLWRYSRRSLPDQFYYKLIDALGLAELRTHPDFLTNRDRFERRAAINAIINAEIGKQPIAHWLEVLNARTPPTRMS